MEILLFIIFLFMISTVPFKQRKNLDWMRGPCAHRGLFTKDQKVAENSKTAFIKAIKHKLSIELDVRITKDDVLIVFHDETTGRMLSIDQPVEAMTYNQLKQYKLGLSDDTILTFSEFLELVDGQVGLLIEIKPTPQIEKVCMLTASELDHYQGHFSVCSFHPKIVRWFSINRPTIVIGQILKNFFNDTSVSILNRFMLSVNGYGLYTRANYISVEYTHIGWFKWMRWLHPFVCAWSVADEKWIHTNQNKVDCIILEHVNIYE